MANIDCDIDIDEILNNVLENSQNENILHLTTNKILQLNTRIIKDLLLTKDEANELLKKLSGYRYLDAMDDLKPGTYVRWISLIDNGKPIKLERGGLFCETKITQDGLKVVIKHPFYSKHYTMIFDDYLFFQKLTNQELILLAALDHLSEDNDSDDDESDNL
jgi:hypothetical protein